MKIEDRSVLIQDNGHEIVMIPAISTAIQAFYCIADRGDGLGIGRIDAIKLARAMYNIGLKEAKDLCDYLHEHRV